MRHGPAEDHADSSMDSDRALTAAGRERVRSVAKCLHAEDEDPLEILTSPLVRAVQTAEIVALAPSDRQKAVNVRRELSPGATGANAMIAAMDRAGHKRVMLVGHEPDLSELLMKLVARVGDRVPRSFEKAMVVGLHTGGNANPARLRFVLDPRALKLDPDERAPR